MRFETFSFFFNFIAHVLLGIIVVLSWRKRLKQMRLKWPTWRVHLLENWFGKGSVNISVNISLAAGGKTCGIRAWTVKLLEKQRKTGQSHRAKGLASWFVGFDFFNTLMMGHGLKFMTFSFSHRLIENYFWKKALLIPTFHGVCQEKLGWRIQY